MKVKELIEKLLPYKDYDIGIYDAEYLVWKDILGVMELEEDFIMLREWELFISDTDPMAEMVEISRDNVKKRRWVSIKKQL